eukprot:scaffold56527_cov46-Phaeocystis_antarctica.AAC.1
MVLAMKWQQLCGVQNRLFWGGSQPSEVAHACWGEVPGIKSRRLSPTFGVRCDKGVSRGSPFPGAGRGLKYLSRPKYHT